MTVLGDFNQAIFAHAGEAGTLICLKGLFGPEETASLRPDRSYRSTRQIVHLRGSLIPGGEAIEPFNRDGPSPA